MQPLERFLKATFTALEIVLEMAVKSLSENVCAGQPLFWKHIVPGKIYFLEISLGVGYNHLILIREREHAPYKNELWCK